MNIKKLFIRNIFIAPLLFALAVIASACSHSDEPAPAKEPSRTVIVYMVANNNLGTRGYDRMDIEEMQAAAVAGAIPKGSHLVVYHGARQKQPVLKEVTAQGITDLKTYPGDHRQGLSLTPERMREVLDDVAELAPADSYALVLWSHGTGWVETSDSRSALTPDIMPLSFGDDYGAEMKVTTLAQALEGRSFDFIYFDACLMGSVEVAYELRKLTPWIVGSPTELQVYGMPYHKNVPMFFLREPDLVGAARNTYEYYADGTDGMVPAASMVVIDTRALDDLASATRDIMATGALPVDGYRPVQFYGQFNNAMVDMADYITHLVGPSADQYARWNAAYGKTVVYKAATPTYGRYDLAGFNGMACAMMASPADTRLNGYRNQAWWTDVVSHNPALNDD